MRRVHRYLLLAVAVLGAFPAGLAAGPIGALLCDSLADQPVRYDVDFEDDIQPHLGGTGAVLETRCTGCHFPDNPVPGAGSGALNLRPESVQLQLLGSEGEGEQSAYYAPFVRVLPGKPYDSVLFVRMSCDDAPGGRMPASYERRDDPAFLTLQAAVHDWIALGAIMDNTDRRFVGDFESIR